MMTEKPFLVEGFDGPHSKRLKLCNNDVRASEKYDESSSKYASSNTSDSKSNRITTSSSHPSDGSVLGFSESPKQPAILTSIANNCYAINSVDSEKLNSSPNSMAALSTSSSSTDESGYQSGCNSSTPQPTMNSNMMVSFDNPNGQSNQNSFSNCSSGPLDHSVLSMPYGGPGQMGMHKGVNIVQHPPPNLNNANWNHVNKQYNPNSFVGTPSQSSNAPNCYPNSTYSGSPTPAYMLPSQSANAVSCSSTNAVRSSAELNGGNPGDQTEQMSSQKDILTRQQLIFFFCHSSVCLVKNNSSRHSSPSPSQHSPAVQTNTNNCKVPHCSQSKSIMQHLQQCANSRMCGVPSCLGLRWARDHYSNCKSTTCIYCDPVRRNRPAFNTNPTNNSSSELRKKLRDWIMSEEPLRKNDNGAGRKNPRFELKDKTRLSCIANMVSAIIPTNSDASSTGSGKSGSQQPCLLANDDQARQVIYLTRQVELDVYYEATNNDQYFEMMARKSYEFQKRMEQLQTRQQQQQQQQSQQQQNQIQNNQSHNLFTSLSASQQPVVNTIAAPNSASLDQKHVSTDQQISSSEPVGGGPTRKDSSGMGNFTDDCGSRTKTPTNNNNSILSSLLSSSKDKDPSYPQSSSQLSESSESKPANTNENKSRNCSPPVDKTSSNSTHPNAAQNKFECASKGCDSEAMDCSDSKKPESTVKEEPKEREAETETDDDSSEAKKSKSAEEDSGDETSMKEEMSEESCVSLSSESCSQTCSAAVAAVVMKRKVFVLDEIRQHLWPVLQHIIGQPESEPFRVPVDYESLGLVDYPEIVKEPMDISTIRKNMFDEEKYCEDPWLFISHMQLMFANAWLYNRKATKIYKSTTRLSEVFYEKIDDAMRKLGFCCGQHLTFSPIPIYCYQKLCHIPRDCKYFVWTNTSPKSGILSEKYIYCNKCFNEVSATDDGQPDEFPVSDEPGVPGAQVLNVAKSAFEQVTNNNVETEKFVQCVDCGRNWHIICAMYLPAIAAQPSQPPQFHCATCLRMQGNNAGFSLSYSQKLLQYSASRLPTNKMASFIERSVNKFLKPNNCPHISVRVLSCSTKMTEVQPKMQARFPDYPKQFPYRNKALFAFTQVDSRDVCIFGMTVQEYGSDCPQPNTRRVYLSYLDSVFFFEPRRLRTALYHRILIAYLDYCKHLGYDYAHIWACPPGEGDDYIFHCHPIEQKTPKPKRLQDWYKSMLDQALLEGVISEFKDIQKACEDSSPSGFTSATQLPYFEGDYWPKVLEDLITQVGTGEAVPKNSNNNINSSSHSSNGTAPGSASVASLTAEDEMPPPSVESDLAMTPGTHSNDGQTDLSASANSISSDQKNSNDEMAGTPPCANDSSSTAVVPSDKNMGGPSGGGDGRGNENSGTATTQKQPRKKSKKWTGSNSSRQKQRKQTALDLTDKVVQNMNSCRDSFFTIKLQQVSANKLLEENSSCSDGERSPIVSAVSEARKRIEDPDPDVHYELMEGRDSFLHMSREKYWEFSSLRRAKYSTMCMLHELHTAGNSLMTGPGGADADSKVKEEGKRTEVGGSGVAVSGISATSKAELMTQYIKVLVHATTCRNANCTNPAQCPKFKQLLSHVKSCSQRNSQNRTNNNNNSNNTGSSVGCKQCNYLFKMFLKHAETCNKGNQPCSVPYCHDIRRRNSRQDIMLRRRMAMMMQRTNPQSSSTTPSYSASSPLTNSATQKQPSTPYASSSPSTSSADHHNAASLSGSVAGKGASSFASSQLTGDGNGTSSEPVATSVSLALSRQQSLPSSVSSSSSAYTASGNPPPGALEAAQRAKTMAAMQSSAQAVVVYGMGASNNFPAVSGGGGGSINAVVMPPNNMNMAVSSHAHYNPITCMGALPSSYQQNIAASSLQSMGNMAASVPVPPMQHPSSQQMGGAHSTPQEHHPSQYHMYHAQQHHHAHPHPGQPQHGMEAGGAMYHFSGGGVPVSVGSSPYGQQMAMMSAQQQQQNMMRGMAPPVSMYYGVSPGNQHQMQMAQVPLGQHPMRASMMRGGGMGGPPGMVMGSPYNSGGPGGQYPPQQWRQQMASLPNRMAQGPSPQQTMNGLQRPPQMAPSSMMMSSSSPEHQGGVPPSPVSVAASQLNNPAYMQNVAAQQGKPGVQNMGNQLQNSGETLQRLADNL